MPAPLFPFTWQYNNQPIEVLAENIAQFVTNPTAKVIPVCSDTTVTSAAKFIDSSLWDDAVSLRTVYTAGPGNLLGKGFKLDYVGNKFTFGDYNATNNSTTLSINDALQTARMISKSGAGPATTFFGLDGLNATLEAEDALTATTAGSAAAKFLKIKVGTTAYKIQLLDA